MKIAILSDIHDNIWNLEKAIQIIKAEKCESIIFLGDFCSPFTLPYLTSLAIPVYACFGNNDEDQGMIIERSEGKIKFWPLAKEFAEIEIDAKKIAFIHYPKMGSLLAKTGDYDAVFHGHTHDPYQENIGITLLSNPGSICGIQKGRPGTASFGVYNTSDNTINIIEIK